MSYYLREQPALASNIRIEWEECACLLCGSKNWSPLVEAPDRARHGSGRWFLVVQCQECGLCFTNPRPCPDSMAHFYRVDYPPHQHESGETKMNWWRRHMPSMSQTGFRKRMPLHGLGRLLDFGCGTGTFLGRMQKQGWKVTGIDQSTDAVLRVRDELGIPAIVGSLPNDELEHERFDVITMWQSLEHVHQPAEVLRAARRVLAPGGKIIIAVPNIDSLPFRWFGQAWNGLDLPRHLTHFAPWTLRLMLYRAGLRPGPVRMVRRSGWVRSSAQLACRLHPVVPRFYRLLRGRTTSNLASWYSFLTRQSDCMMVTATAR